MKWRDKNDEKTTSVTTDLSYRVKEGIIYSGRNPYEEKVRESMKSGNNRGKALDEASSYFELTRNESYFPSCNEFTLDLKPSEDFKNVIETEKEKYEKAFGIKFDLEKLKAICTTQKK